MRGQRRNFPALLGPSPKPELAGRGAGGLISEELAGSGRLGKRPGAQTQPSWQGSRGSLNTAREKQHAWNKPAAPPPLAAARGASRAFRGGAPGAGSQGASGPQPRPESGREAGRRQEGPGRPN